jgi:hypothetical protein
VSSEISTWTVCFLTSSIAEREERQAFNDSIASRLRQLGFNVVRGSRATSSTIGFTNRRKKKLNYVDYFTGESRVVELANAYIASAEDVSLVNSLFTILATIDEGVTKEVMIILTPASYWTGLLNWFNTTPIQEEKINHQTLERITLLDDPESIVARIVREKNKKISDGV